MIVVPPETLAHLYSSAGPIRPSENAVSLSRPPRPPPPHRRRILDARRALLGRDRPQPTSDSGWPHAYRDHYQCSPCKCAHHAQAFLTSSSTHTEQQADGEAYDNEDDDEDATPPGIVLRTDYSSGSDEAWTAFCGALRDAEREFFADQREGSASASAPDDGERDVDVEMAAPVPASLRTNSSGSHAAAQVGVGDGEADGDAEDDDEAGADQEGEDLALFSLVSDSTRFDGISNLRALRLLFDVSVRAAPGPLSPSQAQAQAQAQPQPPSFIGSARHQHQHQHRDQHQHRLIRKRALQETYETRGRTLWIFDARSRIDNSARLVSEAGDVATSVPHFPPTFSLLRV